MKVFRARAGQPSENRTKTFSGTVWADPVMPTTDNITMGNVSFAPGARTFWHSHQQGQILVVSSGCGYVCKEGEEPHVIRAGDVVWIAAGERHWHGAASDSYMVHMATSLGVTKWEEEVPEEVYRAAVGNNPPKML